MRESLEKLLEEEVRQAGFELYHWALRPGRKRRTLQVFLYAEGGVKLDDCAAVSRRLSRALDEDPLVSGSYVLEVSSPGLDRPLLRPWHFRSAKGQRVRLVQQLADGGHRSLEGTVQDLDGAELLLETETDEPERLALESISKARIVPDLSLRKGGSDSANGGKR
jgi:ribosome maturation factor RimP